MSVIDDVLKKHRKRIAEREEAAFREMLRAYEEIERVLEREIRGLRRKVEDARAKGEEISPAWFARENRLEQLIDQVKTQMARFARAAAPSIGREQREAIEIAYSQAAELIELIAGRPANVGSMLSTRVIENAVGFMGDGSPLLDYFEETLSPAVAQQLRSEVIEAAATGKPFDAIARRLRMAGDITRARALATARTEVQRVRRETALQIYQENSDVVEMWEWVSAKSSRTCPACLALDGRRFKLKDRFPQHVNCRCTMIPVIVGVTRPPRTIGSEWFDRQPEEEQIKILGRDAAAAYRRGEVKLSDFVGWKTHKHFGRSIYTKPLSAIISKAE